MKKLVFATIGILVTLGFVGIQPAESHTPENNGSWHRAPNGVILGCTGSGEECRYVILKKV